MGRMQVYYRNEPTRARGLLNALAYGADPSGVRDSHAAIQKALDELTRWEGINGGGDGRQASQLYIPPGTYKIGSQLELDNAVGIEIIGAGKWNTKLLYDGDDDDTLDFFKWYNCRNCNMRDLDLSANEIELRSLLLLEGREPQGGTDVLSSHHNTLDRVIFRGTETSLYGLAIDTTAAAADYHNDYHVFRSLEIVDCAEAGIRIHAEQQKGSLFEMCHVSHCHSGVRSYDQAGAIHWLGGFMHSNDVADFNFSDAIGDAIVISHMGSENSARFILNQAAGDTGNGLPLTVLGCRWTSDGMDPDEYFMIFGNCGPINIQGNIFGFTTYGKPKIKLRSSVGVNLVLQDNLFDSNDSVDDDPIAYENNADLTAQVVKRNNYYRDGGVARTMARRSDEPATTQGPVYFGGVTAAYPYLKRNTTAVQVNLADDSAPGDFVAREHYGFNASFAETIRLAGSTGRLLMAAAGQLTWSAGVVADTPDVTLVREAVACLRVTDGVGLAGTGSLNQAKRLLIRNSGSADTVEVTESDSVFTNESTPSRQDFNLPAAAAGLTYTFYCKSTNGVRVIAATGDTIRIEGSVSATAGRIDSTTEGSAVTLVAINATEWVATSVTGTWAVT